MNDPVTAFDLGRMLFGDQPPLFLLEIVFRTVVIYGYTLVLIRWIGSRPIAQLSLVEFLLVIALGSAVGDAMFYPDVPLVHCMLVITVVVMLDKLLSFAVTRSSKLEDLIEGKSVQVVRDGVINRKAMDSQNFGHDELFEQLRLNEIEQLGQVRASYLETNGLLSVFKQEQGKVRPGLSINPPWDVRKPVEHMAGETARGTFACAQCATTVENDDTALPKCTVCGGGIWHQAESAEQPG